MALDTECLETSFALLRDRETEFSQSFYSTLFLDYPQVQPLFKSTHMDEQAKKLFASLVLVINNLTKPDVLTNTLRGMGTRHVKYGVLPEHYPMVGGTLIKTMGATLGEQWTPEFTAAWTEAYGAITTIMLEGTDYPEAILQPN
jgi:hemoglobin-like flavoprotein